MNLEIIIRFVISEPKNPYRLWSLANDIARNSRPGCVQDFLNARVPDLPISDNGWYLDPYILTGPLIPVF